VRGIGLRELPPVGAAARVGVELRIEHTHVAGR
jgi:hypothetical protein